MVISQTCQIHLDSDCILAQSIVCFIRFFYFSGRSHLSDFPLTRSINHHFSQKCTQTEVNSRRLINLVM